MKGMLTLLWVDSKLTVRNIFFWITIAFLVLIVVTVNFLLPSGSSEAGPITIIQCGLDLPGTAAARDAEELRTLVQQSDRSIGIYQETGTFRVYVNSLSTKQVHAALNQLLGTVSSDTPVRIDHLGAIFEPAPFNERMVPLFISCEAVVTGIMLSGVLILTEKSEGILRAYRLSPGGALRYMFAKTLLFSIVGSVYSLLIAILTVGFTFSAGALILLAFTASAMFTFMGITMTVFMRSVSNWLMLLAFVVGTNMLAMFAYIFPAIPVDFMKVLPAYPVIFAFEDVLFSGTLDRGFGTIVLWTMFFMVLCFCCVRFRLLRPHKGE